MHTLHVNNDCFAAPACVMVGLWALVLSDLALQGALSAFLEASEREPGHADTYINIGAVLFGK